MTSTMNEYWLRFHETIDSLEVEEFTARLVEYENIPGISPAQGYVDLLCDLTPFEEVRYKGSAPQLTGNFNRGNGRENSGGRLVTSTPGRENISQGVRANWDVTPVAYERFDGEEFGNDNAVDIQKLLDTEFSLFLQGTNDPEPVQIKKLRAFHAQPLYPPGLNRYVVCRVYFTDRRDDWMRSANYFDQINVAVGISRLGKRGFSPYTVFNPLASDSNKKPFSLKQVILYLLGLMGEFKFSADSSQWGVEDKPYSHLEIRGHRGTGFVFPAEMDKVFVKPEDRRLAGLIEDLSDIPESIIGQARTPAVMLKRVLDYYGYDIWLTNGSAPLIVSRLDKPTLPPASAKLVEGVPSFASRHSKRTKRYVFVGGKIKVQECFLMREGADFDYVVNPSGEWMTVDDALESIGLKGMRSDLARQAFFDRSGNFETVVVAAEALAKPPAGGLGETLNIYQALMTQAFRYVRLKRTGKYNVSRRLLPQLLDIGNDGAPIAPVIVSKLGIPVMVRAKAEGGGNEFNAQGDVEFYTHRWPQNARVANPESLILSVDQPMVYPVNASELTSVTDAPSLWAEAKIDTETAMFINTAANTHIEPVDKFQLLCASELSFMSESMDYNVYNDRVIVTSETDDDTQRGKFQMPTYVSYPGYDLFVRLASFQATAVNDQFIQYTGPRPTPGSSSRFVMLGPKDEQLPIESDAEAYMPLSLGLPRTSPGNVVEPFQTQGKPYAVGIFERARRGLLGASARESAGAVSSGADKVLERIKNSYPVDQSVDLYYEGCYKFREPDDEETSDFLPTAYLRSYKYRIDDNKAETVLRFGSDEPLMPRDVDLQARLIEYANQRAVSRDVDRVEELFEAFRKSATTATERDS